MGVKIHDAFEQGSEAWLQARCGILTASEMKLVITPTLKVANNEKERAHLYELMAQRISSYVEPRWIGDDMLRGMEDEIEARHQYGKHFAPVTECGFITNDKWGFTVGYSPDGLVGDDGLIEAKSRRQKFQVQTMVENVANGTCPDDFLIQCQTGLLVSERRWLDFVSYCGGLPMAVVRIWPDDKVQHAIVDAAAAFEARMAAKLSVWRETLESMAAQLVPTERSTEMEMV